MSSYFHSASQSCPILSANCRYNLRLFRLFRGDSSGMDKSSSAKCLLYSDVVKGEPSPTGRGRRSRDDQSRNWRYSFHNHFTTFFYLFLFFNYFTFTLFPYFFSPTTFTHTHTHTHDPRSLPTTHDPRHLATLAIFWGLISIATLRLRCHDLIYRCLCANPTLFWNTINRMRSYMYFWALFLNKRAAASSIKGCAFAGIAIVQQQNRKKKKTM